MEYLNRPNLLLEALAYLGRRASGSTWERVEQRIRQRRIVPEPAFQRAFRELKALTARLDAQLVLDDAAVQRLFGNLEGFPYNTIGSYSVGFLLFFPALTDSPQDLDLLLARLQALAPEQVAYHIAAELELTDGCGRSSMPDREFLDAVLALSVPDASKVALLNACRHSRQLLGEAADCLRPVLQALEAQADALAALADVLRCDIAAQGCEGYLAQFSRLEPAPGISYCLRPFVFGMDTNLMADPADGVACVYCGILRKDLLNMLSGQAPVRDNVYEAFRLLGDRTRFDILCYLKGRSAYGQELSTRFGLSRNTIHHHMNKLIGYGLISCTTDGNRIYYSLDSDAVKALLRRQYALFCGEPEPPETP